MESAVEIKLTDEGKAALAQLRKNIDPADFKNELLKMFDKLSSTVAGYIIKNLLSGQLVYRRTGTLARSVVGRGVLMNGVPAIRVGIFRGPALAYAGVVDQGTQGYNPQSPYPTIRPKNVKALAVPVNDALTPAGVARYKGPRDYPGELVYVPINRGKLVGMLVDKSKIAQGIKDAKASYLLLLWVDIKPRFYLMTGMLAALPKIGEQLSQFFVSRLGGTFTGSRGGVYTIGSTGRRNYQ